MVDLRINETHRTGAVENRTYRVGLNAVRSETAPTGGESAYVFLEFTIHIFNLSIFYLTRLVVIHHNNLLYTYRLVGALAVGQDARPTGMCAGYSTVFSSSCLLF